MRAGDLEETLHRLGWVFLMGLFFRLSIDGRAVLLPFFAAACLYFLLRLRQYEALGRSPWFDVAVGSAIVVIVDGALAVVPAIEPGVPAVIATLGTSIGAMAYVGALRDWCVLQGWQPPAAKARDAMRWCAASAVIVLAGAVALVVFGATGPDGEATSLPASILGRPLEGWPVSIGLTAMAIVWLVAILKLRGASQLIRHSLRAQPDAELVSA